MNEKNGDRYSYFIWGMILGYTIRHYCPPKETPAWQWWILGIIVVIVLWVRIVSLKPGKKKEG